MFKKTLKKILKKTGYTIHKYNKDNVCTNFNDFTPFQDGQNKNKSLYYEAIEKSQNLQSDNFSKRLRYYSLNQLVDFVLKKENVSDFVECGCWKGHSAYMISKLILASKKKINFHIFDSFEGLSESTEKDENFYLKDKEEKKKISEYFSGSEDFVKNQVLKDFNFIKTYKGWIPEKFKKVEDRKFSFVHIDVDLYEPTLKSLEFFYPKLEDGGIIVCDDYNFVAFPGAKNAWDEYFKDKKYKMFYEIPFGACFLIK